MDKTPEYLEREFIKGIFAATAIELKNKGINQPYGSKTKLAKIICIVADNENIPITRSWYSYGQYPFTNGLQIELNSFFLSIFNEIDKTCRTLSGEAQESFEKASKFFKKFNVVNNVIKKNLFEFLESYYHNKKFNDMEYISLYRTFFHLNNFMNNNFYNNLNKKILPKKIDYVRYLVEEVDIAEEDSAFEKYCSQRDKIRTIFNSFLFEVEKTNYLFQEKMKEKVYTLFDNFEKACLKMDLILESRSAKLIEIRNFEKLNKYSHWYWSLLASFISTQKNEGMRKKLLIDYYTNSLKKKLSEEKTKSEEVNKLISNTNLELSREDFFKVKKHDKEMFSMIHNFTTEIL